jgi:hypothetical protein
MLSCSLFEPNQYDDCSTPDDYPSKSCLLASGDLQALQDAINTLSEGYLKAAQLDSFGYITSEGVYQGWSEQRICQSRESQMITWAKEAVLKYGEYTGLPDSPTFEVLASGGTRSDSGECDGQPSEVYYNWMIRFQNQVYEGLEVLNTRINVGLYSEGAYWIEGHWYPEITIPDCDSVTCGEAKELVLGTEITWYGFGGEPHIFTVEDSTITDVEEKVILPFRSGDCIEHWVVWRIGILFGSMQGWYIYVDIITGEIVGIEQLFRT